MAQSNDTLQTLTGYVESLVSATGIDETVARSQMFAPTGYPDKLQIAPGMVMSKPDRFDYAPDIEVADRKVRALTASARAGKLAVLNITIEPGSGKTLFLPFKFSESSCLVVLPTVFDAWSAHTANTAITNIRVYGTSTSHQSKVTYTDSYHAAYLMSTGIISEYQIVFIDESHSQEGVTNFMASVARPGQVYVRMTASPPTSNARPKKSFPIMEERDVPNYKGTDAAAAYVSKRTEHRVLVLTPSPLVAEELASRVPRSQTLTMLSPPEQICGLMSRQSESAVIIADFVCGKGVNLNADCVIDFGMVDTPAGVRTITVSEQLQRKARVGRSKPGVYCCSYAANATRVIDNYSVYRSNLWFIANGLSPNHCTFDNPTVRRAIELLPSMTEPALVPEPSSPAIIPPPVTPVIEEDDNASDSGDTVSTDEEPDVPLVDYSKLIIDDQPEPKAPAERDFSSSSWYSYYVEHQNHPTTYVADLIYEHRGIQAKAILVDSGLVVQKAANRRAAIHGAATSRSAGSYTLTRVQGTGIAPSEHGSTWSRSKPSHSRKNSGLGLTTMSSQGVKFGSVGHDLSGYSQSGNPVSPTVALGRAKSVRGAVDIPFDGVHLGGPLAILRGTKVSHRSRGVGYKAVSVCGGYLTVAGVVLSSGKDMHTGLSPLHQEARAALQESTTVPHAVHATHYLSWVVTKPLDSLDVNQELAALNRAGAWSVPPNNVVPTIDLEAEYHSDWVSVVTDRIRNRVVLPPIIPRGGFYNKSRRRRIDSDDLLDYAIKTCDYPCYSNEEQQTIYRAWNILAVRSSSVGHIPQHVFNDAQTFLVYMAGADRLNDL